VLLWHIAQIAMAGSRYYGGLAVLPTTSQDTNAFSTRIFREPIREFRGSAEFDVENSQASWLLENSGPN